MFVEDIESLRSVANRSGAESEAASNPFRQFEPSEAEMIPNQSFKDEAKSWYTRAKEAEQRGLWSDVRRNKAHGDRCMQLDRLQKAYEAGDQKTAEDLIKKGGISELEARVTRDRAALAIQASTGKQMREAIQNLHPNDPKRQRIQNSREYMAARLMEVRASEGRAMTMEEALSKFSHLPTAKRDRPRRIVQRVKQVFGPMKTKAPAINREPVSRAL
jgi:hypothetical protein